MTEKKGSTSIQKIEQLIFWVRGQKIMLSTDLARLYSVETRVLVQAVKRNIERFPEDFMFQLSNEEFENLKSQIVISSWGGMRRAKPYAFTEQGVAMLSSVLRSKRAIQVNIQIMRAFTQLRRMLSTHEDLKRKVESMEKKYDQQFQIVFEAMTPISSAAPPRIFAMNADGSERTRLTDDARGVWDPAWCCRTASPPPPPPAPEGTIVYVGGANRSPGELFLASVANGGSGEVHLPVDNVDRAMEFVDRYSADTLLEARTRVSEATANAMDSSSITKSGLTKPA